MAYDPGAIDATLAAAIGDEPTLIAELRCAFVDSAERAIVAIEKATDEVGWAHGAARLKGLAASFGAIALVQPNGLGIAFVAVQALAVAAIAALQFYALGPQETRVSV